MKRLEITLPVPAMTHAAPLAIRMLSKLAVDLAPTGRLFTVWGRIFEATKGGRTEAMTIVVRTSTPETAANILATAVGLYLQQSLQKGFVAELALAEERTTQIVASGE